MDVPRLDLILRYALAVSRDGLGPIHLMKYAYLADLAYARHHHGETFTGLRWLFLNFGPFSRDVLERVEPAAEAVGAEKRTGVREEDGREYVRYVGDKEGLAEKIRDLLPAEVATAVRHGVQEHGGDTASLLEAVYLTAPILNAAPGEALDFSVVSEQEQPSQTPPTSEMRGETTAYSADLSVAAEEVPLAIAGEGPRAQGAPWKVRKAKKEAMARLRDSVRKRLQARRANTRRSSGKPPRYDAAYLEGLKWLDSLAGERVKEVKDEEVYFPSDIWKSSSRRGPDGA